MHYCCHLAFSSHVSITQLCIVQYWYSSSLQLSVRVAVICWFCDETAELTIKQSMLVIHSSLGTVVSDAKAFNDIPMGSLQAANTVGVGNISSFGQYPVVSQKEMQILHVKG